MKAEELRKLTIEDLKSKIEASKKELNKMKLDNQISPLESPAALKGTKKQIARMLTVLRQKEQQN